MSGDFNTDESLDYSQPSFAPVAPAPNTSDVWLEWNGDFQVSARGGLLLVGGPDYARQRITRRLLTAVMGYVWHNDYGAGLPQKIGRTVNVTALTALVRSQIALEAAVSPSPAPVVGVKADQNKLGLYTITIDYTDAATGAPVQLSFTT